MTFDEWWIEYRGFDDPYKGQEQLAWNAAIDAALEFARRYETLEPEVDAIIGFLVALKEQGL